MKLLEAFKIISRDVPDDERSEILDMRDTVMDCNGRPFDASVAIMLVFAVESGGLDDATTPGELLELVRHGKSLYDADIIDHVAARRCAVDVMRDLVAAGVKARDEQGRPITFFEDRPA